MPLADDSVLRESRVKSRTARRTFDNASQAWIAKGSPEDGAAEVDRLRAAAQSATDETMYLHRPGQDA